MKDEQIYFPSAVLRRTVPIRVLVPDGRNFKCLILLHGYGGDQDQWCRKSGIRELARRYGIAVLMPGCGDGYYEDTAEDLPQFVGEELTEYARKHLPVADGSAALAIAGVSMGGFGALLIGSKYGNRFGKIASFSGAFIIPDVVIGNPGVLGNADPDYFRRVFGDFETLEGSRRDPLAEALRAADRNALPELWLLCGNQDVLFRENQKIAELLRARGVPVVWHHGDGGHTWDFWNAHLEKIMEWICK